MATAKLYPNADDSMTNPWPLSGPYYTLVDDVKGAYDDGATYISNPGGAGTTTMIFGMDLLSSYPVGLITDVQFEVRQRREITIDPHAYIRIAAVDYWHLSTSSTSWTTQNTNSGTSPATSNPWTTAEVDGIQTKFECTAGGPGTYANSTAMNLEVTYEPASGSFTWLLPQWILPIVGAGLASHGLIMREVEKLYSILKMKSMPSSKEELKRILEVFHRRPAYVYLGQ